MMSKTEANAVNTLITWLTSDTQARPVGPMPDDGAALRALGTLLDGAHRSLHAGYIHGDIDRLWPAMASLPRQQGAHS